MKLMPNMLWPRTAVTFGAASRLDTIGYVTWSSTRSGLRPIHSVNTTTCGSDRSGIASTGTLRMATTAATNAIADSTITSPRRLAHHSMSLAIMAASVPGPGRRGRRAGVRGVGAEALDGGLQAALGVDQERGARHHGVALGEPLHHGDAIAVAAAGPHAARLEAPAAPREEHVRHVAGAHHGLGRHHERATAGPRGHLHMTVHAGPQQAVAIVEREPGLERPCLARHGRVDEVDRRVERPARQPVRGEARTVAHLHAPEVHLV